MAWRVGPDDHALQPDNRMRRLTRPQAQGYEQHASRDALSGAGDTAGHAGRVQERVVLRAQRAVLAAQKTIDAASWTAWSTRPRAAV